MSQTSTGPNSDGCRNESGGKYGDEKSLDSGILDSGFLSGVLDSASNLGECGEEEGATAQSPLSTSKKTPRVLTDLQETDYEYDEKYVDRSYIDSGLILDSESLISESSVKTSTEDRIPEDEEQHLNLLVEAFAPDDDGNTTLHSAIAQGFIEVVFSLVRLAPSGKYLNIKNGSGLTPLHLAVLRSQPWAIRRLVIAGCSLSTRDRHGNTALHLACEIGSLPSVRCLMQPVSAHDLAVCPRPPTAALLPSDLELRNDRGRLALHLAALGGHFAVVQLLLIYGADVDGADGTSGKTALHLCAEAGLGQMCQFLIRCRADPMAETWTGCTPADCAAHAGHTALAEELCRLGSEMTPPDEFDSDEFDSEDDDNLSDNEMQNRVTNSP